MRRRLALAVLTAALVGWPLVHPLAAAAAEWGEIAPGTTTMTAVRQRHGAPTRTGTQKVENRDTAVWIYEGAQAPVGARRMTVDFGLVTPAGYRADVVRDFRLELVPGAFNRAAVLSGWGPPSRVSNPGQKPPTFVYDSGLVVTFDDKEGWTAETMLFTPPQPSSGSSATRP